MRALADLLAEKKSQKNRAWDIDEKSLEGVFFEVLERELPDIERADIQNLRLKDKKFFLKTSHPAIAAEIWKKREKLKNEVNNILQYDSINEIRVK